jgi:hypothetical protein
MAHQKKWCQEHVQGLFDEYNRRFWRGRLPHYEIIIAEKHWGSACDRKSRRIYLHPVLFERFDEDGIYRTLIHEMAHAATRGIHGASWQREMRRLNRLRAPVAPDDLDPDSIDPQLQIRSMLAAFEEYGWESPNIPWARLLRRLAYPMGLVTNDLKPVSMSAAHLLLKCRRAFNRGVRHWRANVCWRERHLGVPKDKQ